MPPRLRKPAVIAALLLASAMLSIKIADQGARNPPAASEHKTVVVPPLPQTAPPAEPGPFTFANVQQLAKERAAHEYRQGSQNLPASLANLTYDQYYGGARPCSRCSSFTAATASASASTCTR